MPRRTMTVSNKRNAMKLKLIIALTIAVGISGLFSGCERTPQQPKAKADPTEIKRAYIAGYDAGFALCSDINKGICKTPEEAKSRFAKETSDFTASVR